MSKQPKLFKEDEIFVCNSLTLSEANPLAFKVLSLIDAHLNPIEVVGSIRRQKAIVKDIDFIGVGTAKNLRDAKDNLIGLFDARDAKQKCSGDEIVRLLVPFVRGHIQVDIYRTTEDKYGILKLVRTGSADHNIWLAKYAIKKGMRLLYSEGLIRDGNVVASKDERDIFEQLGLEYVVPTEREMINGKPKWMVSK